jgi:hypothetical protein
MKLLIVLLFVPLCLFSQTLIKGVVKDSLHLPISSVNIQLIEKESKALVDFKTTNENGFFTLSTKQSTQKHFIIKATSLGYKPSYSEINIDKDIVQMNDIFLYTDIIEMKTVEIKADFREVTDRNDTVSYNLKKLLNGSEQKLKDIINKLPGLSIDAQGKINYQGKKIDDFLIEGDEYYGSQHQLGTENITAQMINDIKVLKDFQNLASVKGFESSKRTALNVYLKDEYKNVIKGDIENEAGYKNRYRQHNYVYNFASKIKLDFISDVNDTNNQSLTVEDYLALKRGLESDILNETTSATTRIDDNVPSFLFSEDNVNKKDIQFYSLNFSNKLSKTKKISGYSMFNIQNQEEFLRSKQVFFADENVNVNNISTINGAAVFNTNKFKIENKANERNYYSYTLSVNYNRDKQNSALFNEVQESAEKNNFNENKTTSQTNIGQLYIHKIKINDSHLFEYNLFNDFTSYNNNLDLKSDASFLNLNFDNDTFAVLQKTEGYLNKFGFNAKLKTKIKFGTILFSAGSSLDNEYFETFLNELNPTFNSKFNLITTNNYLGIGFFKKKVSKLNYSFGFKLLHAQFHFFGEKENALTFLPDISFSYEVSKKTTFSLSYRRDFNTISAGKILPSNFIESYRTLRGIGAVDYGTILPVNSLNFSGHYSDFESNFLAFFSVIHNSKLNEVGINATNTDFVTTNTFQFVDLNNTTYAFFNMEKKSKRIPWAIRFETVQNLTRYKNLINNVENVFNTVQNKSSINVLSYFKSNDFNVNFGIEYVINNTKNETVSNENNFSEMTPVLRLNGLILSDKLNWEVETRFIKFSSNNLIQRNILEINPKINYNFRNWNFSLRGVNVMNIRDNNVRVRNNSQISLFESTEFSSLPGFVNLGFTYSF